jgi:ubiquinone biosynthesis accessory factor UbiJ
MITSLVDWAAGQILGFDPEVQTELASFAGKLIQVELVGVGISFYLQPTLTGLQCFMSSEMTPDAVISGTPISLAVMGVSQKFGLTAKPSGVEIRGDAELVHQLTLLMKKFRIDWEEIIAQVVGDRAAQQVGSKLRMAGDYGADAAQRLQSSAIDYIQEEIKLLPPKEEVMDFMADVDELRDRVERLLAVAKSRS